MTQSSKEFAELLTRAIHRIRKSTSKPIYKIEDELGEAINHTRETIEKWRRGRLPADLEQAEIIAKVLLDKGGLVDREEFEEFLNYAGHPRTAMAWQDVYSSNTASLAPNELFVGREEKISELLEALHDQETRVLSLCGPGGVGKTALITEVLESLSPNQKSTKQFPDGILYYNFYGHHSVNGAYSYIVDFFGAEITFDKEVPEETYLRNTARKALRDKRALLVLDGAEEADNLNELLEIRDRNKVLIATRYRHGARGRVVIDLEPPVPEEALSILKSWSAISPQESDFQIWSNDPEDDRAIGIEICQMVGCLPLALRLAGRYMVQCTVTLKEYLDLLKQTPLAVLHERERQHESVLVLLKHSIEALPKATYPILSVVGLLGYEAFHVGLVEEALADSTHDIERLIAELIRFGFVKRLSNNEYHVVHRLIHNYCRVYLPPQDWILKNLAQAYNAAYNDFIKSNPEEYSLESQRGHIKNIVDSCAKHGVWDAALLLVDVFDRCLPPRRFINEDINETESILKIGVNAAQMTDNRRSEANFLMSLGHLFRMERQSIDFFNQALFIIRELNIEFAEIDCLQRIADVYRRFKQWEDAIKHLELILQMAQKMENLLEGWWALDMLGEIYEEMGEIEKAVYYFYQAALVCYKLTDGDESHPTTTVDSDGYFSRTITFKGSLIRLMVALQGLRNHKKAISFYKLFIRSARKGNAPRIEINFVRELIEYLERWRISNEFKREEIAAYKRLFELDPSDSHACHSLAIHYAFSNKLDEASWYYQQRIKLNPEFAIDSYVFFGLMAYHEGREDDARRHFDVARAKLDAYKKLPSQDKRLPEILVDACEFYILLGTDQVKEALNYLQWRLTSKSDLLMDSLFPPFYKLLTTIPNPMPIIIRIKELVNEALRQK